MDKHYPNRIREIREHLELTIEDIAEKTGLSVSYVSRLESGERNLSIKNLNLFAHAFGISPSEIIEKPHDRLAFTAPVMGRIGAGAEIMPADEQVPTEGLYEIETVFPLPEDAIAFEVVGESMWPRYDEGDIIICWRQGINVNEILGWEAAVRTTDGRRFLKRVLKGAEPETYDLESHNAPPIRSVKLDWIAAIQSVIRSGQWKKLPPSARQTLVRKMVGTS